MKRGESQASVKKDERKMFQKTFGPIYENINCKSGEITVETNKEINQLIKGEDIVRFVNLKGYNRWVMLRGEVIRLCVKRFKAKVLTSEKRKGTDL